METAGASEIGWEEAVVLFRFGCRLFVQLLICIKFRSIWTHLCMFLARLDPAKKAAIWISLLMSEPSFACTSSSMRRTSKWPQRANTQTDSLHHQHYLSLSYYPHRLVRYSNVRSCGRGINLLCSVGINLVEALRNIYCTKQKVICASSNWCT